MLCTPPVLLSQMGDRECHAVGNVEFIFVSGSVHRICLNDMPFITCSQHTSTCSSTLKWLAGVCIGRAQSTIKSVMLFSNIMLYFDNIQKSAIVIYISFTEICDLRVNILDIYRWQNNDGFCQAENVMWSVSFGARTHL